MPAGFNLTGMKRCGALVAAVIAASLLAGCGGRQTLDSARLEQQIHHWAVKKGQASPKVKVHCPGDIAVEAGKTFHCILSGGGESVRIAVTVENDDKGYLTWTVG